MQDAPSQAVAQCKTVEQAAALCMDLSVVKRTRKSWAELLGATGGTLSAIINKTGQRIQHMPSDWYLIIQHEAGNRAIAQWFDMESRGQLNHQSTANQKRLLLDQLAQLEQQERQA